MLALPVQSKTPASNTGLIPQKQFKSSVDTLTLVLREVPTAGDAISVRNMLNAVFGEDIEFIANRPNFMMREWSGCSVSSLRGIQLHWIAPTDEAMGMLRVHLPGKAIGHAGQLELRDCIQILYAQYGGDCSRIDVAADDYDRLTNLDDIADAQKKRNYTGVRSHRWVGSGSLTEGDGMTYYFGSKTSAAQMRIYDKTKESKGKVDCIRWELQLRREKARQVCEKWLSGGQKIIGDCASVLTGAIAGAVDFIDRSRGEKDLSRCERLAWWAELRRHFSTSFKLAPPKKEPLMGDKLAWVCTSVTPSLAAIYKYLGASDFWQFVEGEVSEKAKNMSRRNRALVAQAKEDDRDISKQTPWSRSRLKDVIWGQGELEIGGA